MSPFLAWGDFHARSRFARSTIPEEKWGTTRSLDPLVTVKLGGTIDVARFPSLTPFITLGRLGKEPQTKLQLWVMRLTLFLFLNVFGFLVKVALTSFIFICHSFFRVNFLYSKVVFHLICVNFQHPNFMER